MRLTKNATAAVILRDQASPRLSSMPFVEKQMIRPPIPAPAEQMPLARLIFLENHWGRMAIDGMQINPRSSSSVSEYYSRKSC